MAAAGVVIVATLAVTAVYAANRGHPLVKATCIPLSCLILAGILLVAVSIVLYAVPARTDSVCVARSVGFYCAINLMYAPLFVKNVLIYRIFKAGAKKIACTSTRIQILFTFLVVLTQVGLMNMHVYKRI